jgi:tetratricopeptide (TPR) repeat protein
MEDKDLELIERYYRRELDTTALRVFEDRLAADSDFRQEVELHGKALQAIRLKGRENLKKKLSERPIMPGWHVPRSTGKRHRWWIAALALALVAVLILWLKSEDKNAAPPAPTNLPPADTLVQPADSGTPRPPIVQEDKNPSPTKQLEKQATEPVGKDSAKLFAAHFQPYRDEAMNPTVRTEESQDAFGRFIELYWEGRYGEALAAFDKLSPALRANDNTLFIKANALLALGRADEAAELLEKISANGQTRYPGEARWYLALAYLKSGKREKAAGLVKEISEDVKNTRHREAKKLLEAMD